MRRLSNVDAQFLAAESSTGNFGAQYCGLSLLETGDHPLTAGRLRELVGERAPDCPPLRWKLKQVPLGLGNPVFVDQEPDLTVHITESDLPTGATESMVADAVADLHRQKLERSRPLWRMHLLHGLPGVTALVIIVHHAMADGISANLIVATLVDSAVGSAPSARGVATADISRVELTVRSLAEVPGQVTNLARVARSTLANLDLVPPIRGLPGVQWLARKVRRDTAATPIVAPRTRFNTRLTKRCQIAYGSVPLDDVKTVKNGLGVTVNDVVVAMIGGALRRRLSASGDLPGQPLVAYLPVSVRQPEQANDYGNAITSMIAPIPTHLSDALDRVGFARDSMLQAKARTAASAPSLLADVNLMIPSPLLGVATRSIMWMGSRPDATPPVNLILSNVAGFPTALTIDGSPIRANYPFSVIFDGFALNVTVVSYNGSLDIGIVGDASALPDADGVIDDVKAELADLVTRVRLLESEFLPESEL